MSSLAAAALCGLVLVGSAPPEAEERAGVTTIEHFAWKTEGGELYGEALRAFRAGAQGSITRLLAVTPEENRVVVTWRTDYRRGVQALTFFDDVSGWWAELESDVGLDNLVPFTEPGGINDLMRRVREEEPQSTYSFSTAGGSWWQRRVDAMAEARGEEDPLAELASALSREDRPPEGVLEAARFLRALLRGGLGGDLGPHLEGVLDAILSSSGQGPQRGGYADRSWLEGRNATAATEAGEVPGAEELLARFGSVSEMTLFD